MAGNNALFILRGASLDLLARLSTLFADWHFAGWHLDAQVRTRAGELVAALGGINLSPKRWEKVQPNGDGKTYTKWTAK